MSARPSKKLAVLACMDARLHPYELLGLERGEAHIIRNAGGLPTADALNSLSASQRLLGTERVIVIMHRDCGMEGRPEEGGFEDLEATLRETLERLRADESLPARNDIRGLIFDPADGSLTDAESGAAV
jgi:carbonic anhydrase